MNENTIEITKKIDGKRITDRINPDRIKFIKIALHECTICFEEDDCFQVTEDFEEVNRRITQMRRHLKS